MSTHPQGCGVRMHASGAGVQGCNAKTSGPRMLAAKAVRVLGGRVHVGRGAGVRVGGAAGGKVPPAKVQCG